MSVQATYRARPADGERFIDLTRPSEASRLRGFAWAAALMTAGAGLLGFVIGGMSEPRYTATASVELTPDSPAEVTAVRRLLRAPELRAEVASDLGTTSTRLRPISILDDQRDGTVSIEVSGRSRSRVEAIASLTVQRAVELRQAEVTAGTAGGAPATVAHQPRLDGVRQQGLRPLRTALGFAGTALILSLCLLFVFMYLGVGSRGVPEQQVNRKER